MDKITIDGNRVIKDKVIDKDGDLFSIEVQNIDDPDFSFFDMHLELEVGIVLGGSFQRYYSDSNYEVKKGEVWLSNIWEPHGLRINETPTELVFFAIRPEVLIELGAIDGVDWLAPFFSPPELRPTSFSDNLTEKILNLGIRARDLEKSNLNYRSTLTKLIILELLALIQEEWTCPNINTRKVYRNFLKINPALELIFNSKNLITAGEAAKKCGMSEKSFSREFKKLMGISFSRYALGYRVKSAAQDLLKDDLPLKDIVYKWGFTDESHFTKLFYKYFNVPPGKYRRCRDCLKSTN